MPTNNSHDKTFFNDPNVPCLSDTEQNEVQKTLTNVGCFSTLKEYTKGNSPGRDGFPVELNSGLLRTPPASGWSVAIENISRSPKIKLVNLQIFISRSCLDLYIHELRRIELSFR